MQALVIFLRFGSLQSDEKTNLSAMEVFKRTGVKVQSQQSIIRRWRERGFLIYLKKRPGMNRMLNADQVRWLTNIDTLQSMAHLSLRKRAQLISEKFQLPRFNHATLRLYYLRYGVKYKRPDYKFWKSNAENKEL